MGLTADCVVYDLEDSVAPGRKGEARSNVRKFLEQRRPAGVQECAVRINAVGTGFEAQDIKGIVCDCVTNILTWLIESRPISPISIPSSFPR